MTCRRSIGAQRNLYKVRVFTLQMLFLSRPVYLLFSAVLCIHLNTKGCLSSSLQTFPVVSYNTQVSKSTTLAIKLSKRPVNSAQWFHKCGAGKDLTEVQRSDSQVDISTFVQGPSQVPELQKEQQLKCFSAIWCDISDCLFKINAYSTLCPWWGICGRLALGSNFNLSANLSEVRYCSM